MCVRRFLRITVGGHWKAIFVPREDDVASRIASSGELMGHSRGRWEARYGLSGLYLHMRHYEQAGAMWASLALCLCVRWV